MYTCIVCQLHVCEVSELFFYSEKSINDLIISYKVFKIHMYLMKLHKISHQVLVYKISRKPFKIYLIQLVQVNAP